jgi:hypothetical protein
VHDDYERRIALSFVERLVKEGYDESEIAYEVELFRADDRSRMGRGHVADDRRSRAGGLRT